MKKIIASILAVLLIFSFSACGNNGTNGDNSESTETVTIRIANYDSTNSFTVACIEKFIEYAEDASEGTIKFETNYGGTLCSMQEEYEYMKSGSVDMIAMIPPFCMSELPYVYAVTNIVGEEDIVSYTDWLWFENEETASIIDKYTSEYNVKLLGTVDAGSSILCANYEVKSYNDMTNGKLGLARDFDVFDALGLNPVNVDTTEAYDSLNRGVCNSYSYTPSSYYMNSIYEVAPYVLNLKVYGNSNTYMISREKWNSLSEDQKKILEEAMDYTQAYSVEQNKQSVEDAKGVADAWYDLSETESTETCQLMEMANNTLLLQAADNLGTTDDMMSIIKAKEEYTGIEQTPEGY